MLGVDGEGPGLALLLLIIILASEGDSLVLPRILISSFALGNLYRPVLHGVPGAKLVRLSRIARVLVGGHVNDLALVLLLLLPLLLLLLLELLSSLPARSLLYGRSGRVLGDFILRLAHGPLASFLAAPGRSLTA